MANQRAVFKPSRIRDAWGHNEHAWACNRELARAAQCAPRAQSLIADALRIARGRFASGRGPLA
eukprot:3147787-Pyramimonas_sp.AAC.1